MEIERLRESTGDAIIELLIEENEQLKTRLSEIEKDKPSEIDLYCGPWEEENSDD